MSPKGVEHIHGNDEAAASYGAFINVAERR